MGTTTATKEIEIIETLGRMAAECDLWAETPELSYRERADAARKAAEYRAKQVQPPAAEGRNPTDVERGSKRASGGTARRGRDLDRPVSLVAVTDAGTEPGRKPRRKRGEYEGF